MERTFKKGDKLPINRVACFEDSKRFFDKKESLKFFLIGILVGTIVNFYSTWLYDYAKNQRVILLMGVMFGCILTVLAVYFFSLFKKYDEMGKLSHLLATRDVYIT